MNNIIKKIGLCFIVVCCMSLVILIMLDQTRISHGGSGGIFSSKNIFQTGLDLIAVIIAYGLYKYFSKILTFRPLRGFIKLVFIVTAILFATAMFILSIASFPYKKHILTKKLFEFTAIALTVSGLWLWYRFLLIFQPKCQTELNCRPQLENWQLSPERIEIQNSDTNHGEALIIRPKESQSVSEYYFIVLDGTIVAALRSGEFTKVKLQNKAIEIGCYAKSSHDNDNTNYLLNVGSFEANPRVPLALTVTPDIFVGSCISKISSMEAQIYQKQCNYVDQGPRHNTRLDQSATNPPPVSL